MEAKAVQTGKVKWFNDDKGYGFIEAEDGTDVFVHFTAILKRGYRFLRQGQTVHYEAVMTEKGWQAADVAVAE